MFTETDYDKLKQIMDESPEKKELLTKLLDSHQMDISTISHEIRNPLTLVYSTLQLIESAHPEVLHFKHWSDMHTDIEYMKQLLEELSVYNNGGRLSISHINADTFLKTVALSFASSIIDTDIEFVSHIEPELPSLYADSIKIKEVLLNLLKNACDAVRTTSYLSDSHPQIRFDAHTELDSLIITVSDNGCGILPEQITSIFEPFITYKKDGTGLGLALASRIATAHGGSLTVSSDPGVLTTFTLMLPIQQQR